MPTGTTTTPNRNLRRTNEWTWTAPASPASFAFTGSMKNKKSRKNKRRSKTARAKSRTTKPARKSTKRRATTKRRTTRSASTRTARKATRRTAARSRARTTRSTSKPSTNKRAASTTSTHRWTPRTIGSTNRTRAIRSFTFTGSPLATWNSPYRITRLTTLRAAAASRRRLRLAA